MSTGLSEILNTYSAPTLAEFARYNEITFNNPRLKVNMVRALEGHFSNLNRLKPVLESLSPAEKAVIHLLQRQGGRARLLEIQSELFARKLADPQSITAAHYDKFKPRLDAPAGRSLPDILARLQALGLVFAEYQPDESVRTPPLLSFKLEEDYFIPEMFLERLPPPPPPPPPPELPSLAVERVLESSARTFQRDLFLYWSYLHEQPAPVTAKGLLQKRALSGLNAALQQKEEIGVGKKESDFPRLLLLRALAERLLLVEWRGAKLVALDNPAFFSLAPDQRLRRTFTLYLNGGIANELAWYPNLKLTANSSPPLPTPEPVAGARRALLVHLKQARDWVSMEGLIQFIGEVNRDFLFRRGYLHPAFRYYYSAYHTHPYQPLGNPLGWEFTDVQDAEAGWSKVEAGFIRDVITKSLFWMGLVDLGFRGQESAFRLTPVGAWLLGVGPQPEIPVEGGQVIVQPNFHIMAFDPVSDAVLVDLSRFAERVASERVSEFRLTRASVYAAQRVGWGVDRIRAHLEALTGSPLPANVRRTLEEWQALHERIRVYPGLKLVHAADPQELDSLLESPDLEAALGRRFEPRLAQVRSPRLGEVVRKLYQHDQLPLVHRGESRPRPRSITLLEEPQALRLRFAVPLPDLYLHGYLAPFADPEEGGYRVTAQSLRRAAAGGLEAGQVIETLEEISGEPLSEKAARRIRAWAGYYGNASLEQTFLLELESENILQELLADEEVGPLLRKFKPGETLRLVRVRPKDLEKLQALLEERGLPLRRT